MPVDGVDREDNIKQVEERLSNLLLFSNTNTNIKPIHGIGARELCQ